MEIKRNQSCSQINTIQQNSRYISQPSVTLWNEDQVMSWLNARFKLERQRYIKTIFKEQHLTGLDLLELTDSELKNDIGICVLSDRKSLLREIKILRSQQLILRQVFNYF